MPVRVIMSALLITVACIMAELHIPLDIKSLEILSQHINSKGEIILTVQSKKTETPFISAENPRLHAMAMVLN